MSWITKKNLAALVPAFGALAILLAVLGGCGGIGGSTAIPSYITQLTAGGAVGKAVFPLGDTSTGGQGPDLDSIPCDQGEDGFHIHAHLSLFVDGQQIQIPPGIGIPHPNLTASDGFVHGGDCFYRIHTHDATGIIHVESTTPVNYTLGDFFDIWGEPLSSTQIASFSGNVISFVNGKSYTGDLRAIPLVAHEEITLVLGPAPKPLPSYLFPNGY